MQSELARLARLADELLRNDSAPSITMGPEQVVDLGGLIGEIGANLAGRAQRGGVALETALDQGLIVSGDRDRLKQALLNLLDNALRATPPGGSIRVAASATERGIVLDVVDSGPGIPADLREAVWERGIRGADGGSGLGLAIVRSIIEAHGGTAILLPAEEGAHFQLTVPGVSS
jgi:signal transduction histidine kinase